MTDDWKAEGSDASKLPPFVFAWQPSQLESGDFHTLLIWPLAEIRPPGTFARFVVIESERTAPPVVVPMDLESPDRPHAADARVERTFGDPSGFQTEIAWSAPLQEDLGSLPLLLRLPFEDEFSVTVKYLVRRKLDGLLRVEEVAMPSVKFRRAVEANQFTTIGFVRGENTDGPARPIVVTGIARAIDLIDNSHDEALMHIEMVDTVLHAYEMADEGTERRIAAGFVLVVPHADNQVVGPAKTILPYAGARVRTSMEIAQRADTGQTGSESGLSYQPRFRLRIGASRSSRDLLEPGIMFFHWNRMTGFAQSERGQGSSRARHAAPPLTLYRGSMRGADLSFAFDMAGFGDVVGVMAGPPERIVPVFADWPNNEEQFFRHLLDDWTIVPFLWTGDELMPLNYYIHSEIGEVTTAVNKNLLAAAHRLRAPERTDNSRELVRYLQPRKAAPEVNRLIKTALGLQPNNVVIALDPYCELLRELDRQIGSDGVPHEWPLLEEPFSFAMFQQIPELHRALVVLKDLRRSMLPGFGIETMAFSDTSALAVVMAALGLARSSDASRWLKSLSSTNFIAAWELMKRDSELLRILVSLDVVPDVVMLSDLCHERAARILQIYAKYPLAELSNVVQTRRAMGHRHDAALLQEAYDHRRDAGGANKLLPYEKVASIVDLLEGRPVR